MGRPRAVPEWMVTLLVGLLGAAVVRADLSLDLLMPGVTTEAPDSYRAFAVTIPTDLDNSFVGTRTHPRRRGSPPPLGQGPPRPIVLPCAPSVLESHGRRVRAWYRGTSSRTPPTALRPALLH
jgi:hypothetical protein